MNLPFSHDAFLDVFGSYNAQLWPAVAVLWVVTLVLALRWMRNGGTDGRGPFALMAAHWAWSGIVYHWIFFRPLNPAAALFGALFVLQAAVFTWLALTSRSRLTFDWRTRGVLAGALIIYGLLYPILGIGFGLRYPRMPLFAVPCPTTIVTAGLLIAAAGVPRAVNVVPILWAVIGSSAAALLGIRADLALVVAAVLLALETVLPGALGPRTDVTRP